MAQYLLTLFKNNMNTKLIYKKGFTLIELLVVMAIISLLSALVLNSLASARMKANDLKIAQDMRQFRIASELYYNDTREYPTTVMSGQEKSFAFNQNTTTDWSHKLSFFIKTAEAAVTHATLLCNNFDKAAEKLTAKKYLSSIPLHPYDNDSKGICYKAINTTTTFDAYAVLTTQVSVGGGVMNKRTGFILGDTSSSGLSNLNSSTPSGETVYPINSSGVISTDITASVDVISGITSGGSNSTGVGIITSTTTATTTPSSYTLTIDSLSPSSGYYNVAGSNFPGHYAASYSSGSSVTITAYPNSGLITSWTGCSSSNLNICTVSMTSTKSITVYFYDPAI